MFFARQRSQCNRTGLVVCTTMQEYNLPDCRDPCGNYERFAIVQISYITQADGYKCERKCDSWDPEPRNLDRSLLRCDRIEPETAHQRVIEASRWILHLYAR